MRHDYGFCDGAVLPIGEVTVSAFDRTVLYGLGAFETVRLHGGRPFRLERHLARLARSLAAVGLSPPAAVETLPAGVPALSARLEAPSALVRITVTAGAVPEIQAQVPSARPRVLALLRPAPEPERPPVRVGIAPFPQDPQAPLSGVKSTSYLTHYLQRDRAEGAGRLDDLMLDPAGFVIEGTVSNVFAVRAGRLLTPPIGAGLLPGVTRGTVLELAAELGLPVEERPLPRAELAEVDELFLTGAGKCLVGVDLLAGREMPAPRPVTDALRAALKRAIAAECGVPVESIRF